MSKKNGTFKKNDKVKYKCGRAEKYLRGVFVRALKAGSKVPAGPKTLKTTLEPGSELTRDMALVKLKDDTHRLVNVGYLRAA